jgi:predicted  nucleic acid-binding Zn-ribbon protein
MFNEIEQLINELFETISKIRQNRETNVSAVKEQKILVENEIRELRRKIDKHLDKLQEGLMLELTETEEQLTEDTRQLLVSIDEKQTKLTEHQTNIFNIKKYASNLQTFMA